MIPSAIDDRVTKACSFSRYRASWALRDRVRWQRLDELPEARRDEAVQRLVHQLRLTEAEDPLGHRIQGDHVPPDLDDEHGVGSRVEKLAKSLFQPWMWHRPSHPTLGVAEILYKIATQAKLSNSPDRLGSFTYPDGRPNLVS
jgi:hypothetical protein